MAAHLAGALGDPVRFPSASQVFRYSGLVSGRKDSGAKQLEGKGSVITKAGNVYVRRALDQITGSCILNQPVIRQYYHKLLKTKPVGVARVACARRTTAIIWATIRGQRSDKLVMREDTMTT
jgi:transposase